jgi:hypothetical protein
MGARGNELRIGSAPACSTVITHHAWHHAWTINWVVMMMM